MSKLCSFSVLFGKVFTNWPLLLLTNFSWTKINISKSFAFIFCRHYAQSSMSTDSINLTGIKLYDGSIILVSQLMQLSQWKVAQVLVGSCSRTSKIQRWVQCLGHSQFGCALYAHGALTVHPHVCAAPVGSSPCAVSSWAHFGCCMLCLESLLLVTLPLTPSPLNLPAGKKRGGAASSNVQPLLSLNS